MDVLPLSVGIGLAVSLLFSELFGLAAGGMVVPGYIALFLDQPLTIALTVATGILTFGIAKGIGSFVILYGRRRTVLMILVGYVLGALGRIAAPDIGLPEGVDMTVVGYIIPGLLGIWFDRQGVVETLSTLITASVVVRLCLLLIGVEGIAS